MFIKPRRKLCEPIDVYNERVSKLYYNEGYHIKEIAKKLKIDEVEVFNYVSKANYRITTETERQEMIYLYNKGYSLSKIAEITGRSRECVRARIESPAKIHCQEGKELTDRQIKKIKDMASKGYNSETIAKELGISEGTIRSRLSHTDLYKPKYNHVSEEEIKEFVRLRKEGKTYEEIGKICGRGKNTVCRYLKNNKDCKK